MNNRVVDISGKPVIPESPNDLHENVCEHCAYSRFKDTGPHGECRANPPTVGVIVIPKQTLQGVVPEAAPWTMFPVVERRTYCFMFEERTENETD